MTNLNIETIYTTLWDKMLYQVCMQYTNDLSVAQDWCQNGFIKVYNNLSKYKNEGSLEGWVRRVITNSILDDKRRKTIPINYEFTWELLEEETEENRDNEIDDNIQQVLHLKDQLPPSQLQIFELVMDGYKHKEIAKKLNIHEGTSKSNFYKAKGNIRKNLLTKI